MFTNSVYRRSGGGANNLKAIGNIKEYLKIIKLFRYSVI